jgi:hypothetical protein
MKGLNEIIGKFARRHTFLLHNELKDTYHFMFAIVDVLEQDMQDYSEKEEVAMHRTKTSRKNEYNIYYVTDLVSISRNFLVAPNKNYIINGTPITFTSAKFTEEPASNISYVNCLNDKESVLLNRFLPKRSGCFYLNIIHGEGSDIEQCLNEHTYLQEQLSELSQLYLDYNISNIKNLMGDIYFLHYHSDLRDVHCRMSRNPNGIIFTFKYRKHSNELYTLSVINRKDNNIYIEKAVKHFQNGDRILFVPMTHEPETIDMEICDDEGLVYAGNNIHFLKQIGINTMVESKRIHLVKTDSKGNTSEKIISKGNTISTTIGNAIDDIKHIEDTTEYERAEDKLTFFFFDGDPNNKESNVEKARNAIYRILNTANTSVWICDPYLLANEIVNFVLPIKKLDVNIRLITSKYATHEQALEIQKTIDEYSSMQNCPIQCRIMRGKSALHDRFIIADNRVWILGCSLNTFGERATTIAKVPHDSAKRIISVIESWWGDDKIIETLEDYANNK